MKTIKINKSEIKRLEGGYNIQNFQNYYSHDENKVLVLPRRNNYDGEVMGLGCNLREAQQLIFNFNENAEEWGYHYNYEIEK